MQLPVNENCNVPPIKHHLGFVTKIATTTCLFQPKIWALFHD